MNKLTNLIIGNAYIYGFGTSAMWLATQMPGQFKAFIDSDHKRRGQSYMDLSVYSPEDMESEEVHTIVIAAVDIHEILPNAQHKFPNTRIIALGEYIKYGVIDEWIDGKSPSFVEYSLKAVEICHKAFLQNDKKFMRSLDIVITEKCTLKCVDCSNLMQYYDNPINYDIETIKSSFTSLMTSISHIYEVRIIGGEPFINKDAYKIIDFFINHNKVSKVVIYTNATINLKEAEMINFSNPKLVFFVTDYGNLSKNTEKVLNVLNKMNVAFRSVPPNNWTDSAKIGFHNRTIEEHQDIFDKCCGKNLYTLQDSKIYRCPFAANAEKLKAIPQNSLNSVNVNDSSLSISNYLYSDSYLPACTMCNGRSYDAPEIVPAIQTKEILFYKKEHYIELSV
jgi:organic radical activating enzyme